MSITIEDLKIFLRRLLQIYLIGIIPVLAASYFLGEYPIGVYVIVPIAAALVSTWRHPDSSVDVIRIPFLED